MDRRRDRRDRGRMLIRRGGDEGHHRADNAAERNVPRRVAQEIPKA
jgi:hypothetical protein